MPAAETQAAWVNSQITAWLPRCASGAVVVRYQSSSASRYERDPMRWFVAENPFPRV